MTTATAWFVPRSARWALGLWLVLAAVVFSVRFDWNTRMAGHEFVRSQIVKRQQGLPLQTINDGFRPMVRRAALEAGRWLVVTAVAGTALTLVASQPRHQTR
jgi:hypothetical protein